jgi:predicted lipoprotein with Yx(FWY)xxD motif
MNPSAFPSPGVIRQDGTHQGAYEGMSLRDYFAAKAMQGMLANPAFISDDKALASGSYSIADAMLKARES